MNPNRGGEQPTPGFEVFPNTGAEQQSDVAEKSVEAPQTIESSPSRQQSAPVLPVVTQLPTINQPTVVLPTSDDNSTTAARPVNDSSKMERQWIDKAKAIIAQTRDDPFTQKNEMSKVKAAYIEKKFNKKLKVDDAKV